MAVIGGGPAGLAPLLAAHRIGSLDDLLADGVVIIERSANLGGGTIGNYAINSDSTGTTFADCLKAPTETPITALQSHPVAQEVAAAGDGPIPLELAGRFLSLVGEALGRMVAAHPKCAVLTGSVASGVYREPGGWSIAVVDRSGQRQIVFARKIVCATGARQPLSRLSAETVGGVNLVERYGDRLMQSGDVFTTGGLQAVGSRIKDIPNPRIAVIGGSTSAAAISCALLQRLSGVRLGEGAVTILHRRPLRIYYPSVAEALAEGYDEFDENDICPISRRVFRFAGFRLDSRELIMQVRGIGGRPPEPRVRTHHLQPHDPTAIAILDEADLVIAALGYRPNGVPVYDLAGAPIPLFKDRSANAPLVDGACRILDADGAPVPGLFGIGLAAGFVPRGKLGGEPSFSGQANGLWLWQNDVGRLIAEAVMSDAGQPAIPSPAASQPIPLMRPSPPRLSEATDRLRAIEDSRLFSNFGPVNTKFEQDLLARMFDGSGACTTVCNATLGLMLAIRHATAQCTPDQRYALMPSFTFAATAQAAVWCGLTPLFCDIDPATWAADEAAEEALLRRYHGRIAVVVPYATFGYDIDLARYERLWNRHGVPVVVDAAASLGTVAADGRGFGTGFPGAVVFSMHATKSFSTGEGGVIYSADKKLIADLRTMANFGFGAPRSATMIGLNAKLSEISALQAHLRLQNYDELILNRDVLVGRYRSLLPELTFQAMPPKRQAHQFVPALLPAAIGPRRSELQERLKAHGIGSASYFSPHVAEQPYFAANAKAGPLPVTQQLSDRIISLPLFDGMTLAQVDQVCAAVSDELRAMQPVLAPVEATARRRTRSVAAGAAAPSTRRLPPGWQLPQVAAQHDTGGD
jgi:dTDP-4-amino-4,6-dideoxygalactose transaminase